MDISTPLKPKVKKERSLQDNKRVVSQVLPLVPPHTSKARLKSAAKIAKHPKQEPPHDVAKAMKDVLSISPLKKPQRVQAQDLESGDAVSVFGSTVSAQSSVSLCLFDYGDNESVDLQDYEVSCV